MSLPKVKLNVESAFATSVKTEEKTRNVARAYQAPELLVVGKAGELVQGGGGSNADNNRARQY